MTTKRTKKKTYFKKQFFFLKCVSSKDKKKSVYVPKITTMFFVNQFNRLSCILGEIDRRHLNRVDNVTYTQFKIEVNEIYTASKKKHKFYNKQK